jgi:small conductance mechanosensitive channel
MDFLNNIDWEAQLAEHWPVLAGYALKAVGAFIVLIIGLRISGWVASMVRTQATKRPDIDDTLGSFFASITRWFLTAATIIAALQLFGVQATSFVAILGAMTLAIGLSLQGALGNIASGIMVMLFRPYSVGQYVELAGEGGTVKDINLFQTILASPDNVQIIVPNSQAISGVIRNYAGYPTRRVDLVFSVDYGDGLENAMEVIERDGESRRSCACRSGAVGARQYAGRQLSGYCGPPLGEDVRLLGSPMDSHQDGQGGPGCCRHLHSVSTPGEYHARGQLKSVVARDAA